MRINRKYWTTVLIGLLVLLGILRLINDRRPGDSCSFTDRNQVSELEYVAHARCRMKCRNISRSLVERVYERGEVNCKKSGEKNGDMRYALEMKDELGDNIRIIIEDEDGKHIVITAIRMGKDDRCECS